LVSQKNPDNQFLAIQKIRTTNFSGGPENQDNLIILAPENLDK